MLVTLKIMLMVGIGLALTGFLLSKIEWRSERRKSSIEEKHRKLFKGML